MPIHYQQQPLLIIKLGGAAITNKESYRTIYTDHIRSCGKTLAYLYHTLHIPFILIHGAGSYGHYEAKGYKLNSKDTQIKDEQTIYGVAKCRNSLLTLHNELLSIYINEYQLPLLTVPVFSLCYHEPLVLQSTKDTSLPSSTLVPAYVNMAINILQQGGIPILHGDPILLSSLTIHSNNLLNLNTSITKLYPNLNFDMNTSVISGDTIMDVFTSVLHNYTYSIKSPNLSTTIIPLSTTNLSLSSNSQSESFIYFQWIISSVIFITGADGVFDCPPHLPSAQLFQYVYVPSHKQLNSINNISSETTTHHTTNDILIQYEHTSTKLSFTDVQQSMKTLISTMDVTGGIQAKLQYSINMVTKANNQRKHQTTIPNEKNASLLIPLMVSIVGVNTFSNDLLQQMRSRMETNSINTELSSSSSSSSSSSDLVACLYNVRGTHILPDDTVIVTTKN